MATVAAVARLAPDVSFLWHNIIGAGTVFLVGMLLSVGGTAEPQRVNGGG
jgi:hypothetical protein